MIMPLSEIIGAALEAVEKTAEAGEAIEGAEEGFSKLSELGNSFQELSEAKKDYLSELNLKDNVWDSLSPEQCKGHLGLIETRFKEIGVTPTSQCVEGIFDDKLKQALVENNICKDLESVNNGLTLEEKEALKKETGWTDRTVDYISSMEEAQIYKDAGLVEMEVNGKAALIQPNLEWHTPVGPNGETNAELLARGPQNKTWGPADKWFSPRWNDGKQMELHHIGQHSDSPFAELTWQQHRGMGNDAILHDKLKESEIDRAAFREERSRHWISRFLEQK